MTQVQADLRRRILRAFVGRGLLESCDAKDMLGYQHSGFSVDAGVCIQALTGALPVGSADRQFPGTLRDRPQLREASKLCPQLFEIRLLCPKCGGQMRLIAFITDGTQIRKILDHIGVD